MKPMMKILSAGVVAGALLALGAGGGWWWAQQETTGKPAAGPVPAAPQDGRRVLYWYDPMVPQQHFDKPGKSPFMDMALVPKYADDTAGDSGVRIDPAVTQNLGVRLASVERVPLATRVDASGLIGFDERDIAVVQARTGGFVERVWPLAPGDVVRAGQPLAVLLVPEWAAAQHELLAIRSAGDPALLSAARDRLRLLGMPDELIRRVEQRGEPQPRFTVNLPRGGLLQSLDVRAGMTIASGQTLARVNGLSTVWLDVAVPEAYAAWLHPGVRAEAQLAGFPGKMVTGRVSAILPALNEAARSLQVRVVLPNPGGRLRPGLSAQVRLVSDSQGSALAVPTEAVIRTGKRTLVMVAGENGRFAPVDVTPGPEVGNHTVIEAGLAEGQKIVASGQFLIDSEASLGGVVARTEGETTSAPASAVLHPADAKIDEIDGNEITLTHGPFKTLSMPGMTMVFPLARPELTKGLKAGDHVTVFVRQTDQGLVVERLEKTGARP